jgi:hypothetical protein
MPTEKRFKVDAFPRKDTPRFTETTMVIDRTDSTAISVGSYTGSACLSFDVRRWTHYHESDRTRETVCSVAIPYENIEALELLKATVDQAIEDAKAHNEMRAAVRRGAEEASRQ